MHVSMLVKTAVVAAAAALAPQMAAAQFGYYGSWPYGFGYDGGWSAYNTNKNIAASDQSAAQARAMAQNYTVQSGIRSTLIQQDEARALARQEKLQSEKNMWFQAQQQQMAQRRALAMASASAAPAAAGEQVINWPRLLRDPLFTRGRSRIEAPYLRSASGLSQPTAEDYRDMIGAVAQMKELEPYASGYTAAQHAQAEEFLDVLANEARQRAEKMEAAARTPAKTGA